LALYPTFTSWFPWHITKNIHHEFCANYPVMTQRIHPAFITAFWLHLNNNIDYCWQRFNIMDCHIMDRELIYAWVFFSWYVYVHFNDMDVSLYIYMGIYTYACVSFYDIHNKIYNALNTTNLDSISILLTINIFDNDLYVLYNDFNIQRTIWYS
jgi:hypothetical protein